MTKTYNDALEWAAQWIEDTLRNGPETNERTIEFGTNMAMSLRAAKLTDADLPRAAADDQNPVAFSKLAEQIVDAVWACHDVDEANTLWLDRLKALRKVNTLLPASTLNIATFRERLHALQQQIEDTILVAQTEEDEDGAITAYHFKTGAIHRLLALARAGIPVTPRAETGLSVEAALEYEAHIAELERRLRIPFGKLPCALCGGPHGFDTSVPSVIWNSVIRAKGLPDYLCTTCIVREFVRQGQGFTAELWNEEFNGIPIELVVNGQNAKDAAAIQEENNALRNRLSETAGTLTEGSALAELRRMFPLYVITIKVKVGPTPSNVPHYWVDIEGNYSPSVGTKTLAEAVDQVRAWAKSRAEREGERT